MSLLLWLLWVFHLSWLSSDWSFLVIKRRRLRDGYCRADRVSMPIRVNILAGAIDRSFKISARQIDPPSKCALPGRLELPTLRLTASRSHQLSYGSRWVKAELFVLLIDRHANMQTRKRTHTLSRNRAHRPRKQRHFRKPNPGKRFRCGLDTPPAGLKPAIFGLEVRRLVH